MISVTRCHSQHRMPREAIIRPLVYGHTHKPYTKRVNGVLFVTRPRRRQPRDGRRLTSPFHGPFPAVNLLAPPTTTRVEPP
jgi:hypothetical protein